MRQKPHENRRRRLTRRKRHEKRLAARLALTELMPAFAPAIRAMAAALQVIAAALRPFVEWVRSLPLDAVLQAVKHLHQVEDLDQLEASGLNPAPPATYDAAGLAGAGPEIHTP